MVIYSPYDAIPTCWSCNSDLLTYLLTCQELTSVLPIFSPSLRLCMQCVYSPANYQFVQREVSTKEPDVLPYTPASPVPRMAPRESQYMTHRRRCATAQEFRLYDRRKHQTVRETERATSTEQKILAQNQLEALTFTP